MTRKGHCDVCGNPPPPHHWDRSATDNGFHPYTCAADDAIRALRKARFAGSIDDLAGWRRHYDPATHTYRLEYCDPGMDPCGWAGCVHPLGHRYPVGSSEGPGMHDWRPPTEATLLERMRARHVERWRRRERARGETWSVRAPVWHARVEEGDAYDVYGVDCLYADLPSALRGTRVLLGLSRFAGPVREDHGRWTVYSEEHELTVVIDRRNPLRRDRRW